jgi:hypothetical protein
MAWTLFARFALRSTGFPLETLSELKVRPETRAECLGGAGSQVGRAHSREVCEALQSDHHAARRALHASAAKEEFREAVFLSSADMLANLEAEYLAREVGPAPNSSARRWERKAIAYLQRFCTKNETASFFGPKNYGSFAWSEDEPAALRLLRSNESGKRVTAKDTYYAYWAGCSLAEVICRDEQIQPKLSPRPNPVCILEGDAVRFDVLDRRVRIGAENARLLRACDGSRSVEALADLLQLPVGDVLARVRALGSAKAVLLDLPIPYSCEQPVAYLLECLRAFQDAGAEVGGWILALEELESLRLRFRSAGLGDRRHLLGAAEERFRRATGLDARRGGGQIYADRFLLYEECKGVVDELTLGRRTRERMTAQLQPALELCSDYGYLVWRRHQRIGRELFARLSPDLRPIPFGRFLRESKEALAEEGVRSAAARVEPEADAFTSRLEQLLREAQGTGQPEQVRIQPGAIQRPGGVGPAYGLLDLMVAARSFDAIEAGDYRLVLARIHPQMLVWSWLSTFFPDRAQWEADHAECLRKLPIFGELADIRVARRNKAFYCFPGKQVEYLTRVDGDRSQVIPLADLDVVAESLPGPEECLRLRRRSTGEGVWLYLALADFADYVPFSMFALPSLRKVALGQGAATPRVLVGDVVYQRRSWRISGRRLVPPSRKPLSIAEICRSIWSAQEELQIPEHAYARGAEERKPIFVDFGNPLLVELLAHRAGQWETVVFEEMLPGPEELWLRQEGASFCCEMRAGAFFIPDAWTRG